MQFISFLRAINVGGRVIPMSELRKVFESLGFKNVETFIASGNVFFEKRGTEGSRYAEAQRKHIGLIEKEIEEALRAKLGYDVDTFLRTPVEIRQVAEAKPFAVDVLAAATAYNVAFTRASLSGQQLEELASFENAIDGFRALGREIYWVCKTKQSKSKFVSAKMERLLGVRVTWRNLNTVRRLCAKYPPPEVKVKR